MKLRRPKKHSDELEGVEHHQADDRQVAASSAASKITAAAIAGCLAAGPVGIVVGGMAWASGSDEAQVVVEDQSDDRARAGDHAISVVAAWLISSRSEGNKVSELVASAPTNSLRVGREPLAASNFQIAGIEKDNQIWSVTVSAEVHDAAESVTRRYFQVPVAVDGQKVAALALPAVVSGPTAAEAPALAYSAQAEADSPLHTTISDFFAAYLAGTGDVARYTTPGAQITAVEPAPFTATRLLELRLSDRDVDPKAEPSDGATVKALALAELTVNDNQLVTAQYALSLRARDGRWEISQLDPTPRWSPPTTERTPPAPATPSPTEEQSR